MRILLLFIPSSLIVLGLVLHSLRVRGRRETLAFFTAALVFGILRGNIIWWITTVHMAGSFPYIFKHRLIGVFHDALQADIGWILTLYVGYSTAEWLGRRIAVIRESLFHTIALSGLFAVCLGYAVETVAMAMGWWGWNLSTHSRFFSDVPIAGIAAWFSVPVDFLTPFLLLTRGPRRYRGWGLAALAIFPLHMLVHLSNQRLSAALPLTPYNIWYWCTALAAVCLPLKIRVPLLPYPVGGSDSRGRRRGGRAATFVPVGISPETRLLGAHLLLPAAMAGVVGVLLVSIFVILGRPELFLSQVPLLMYLLLVYLPLSPLYGFGAAAGSLLLGGLAFFPVLLPPAMLLLFRLQAAIQRLRLLWVAVAVMPLALSAVFYLDAVRRDRVDRAYGAACAEAASLARQRKFEASALRYGAATALKPESVRAWQELALVQIQRKEWNQAETALKTVVELRPISAEAWNSLANLYVLRGDRDKALATYRKALEYDPKYKHALRAVQALTDPRSPGPSPAER